MRINLVRGGVDSIGQTETWDSRSKIDQLRS